MSHLNAGPQFYFRTGLGSKISFVFRRRENFKLLIENYGASTTDQISIQCSTLRSQSWGAAESNRITKHRHTTSSTASGYDFDFPFLNDHRPATFKNASAFFHAPLMFLLKEEKLSPLLARLIHQVQWIRAENQKLSSLSRVSYLSYSPFSELSCVTWRIIRPTFSWHKVPKITMIYAPLLSEWCFHDEERRTNNVPRTFVQNYKESNYEESESDTAP